jgi:hypothetical protein
MQRNTFRSAMRAQMEGLGSSQASDERDKLDEWLAQSPVPTEDPLRWWLANQKLYPRLSRMAIDVHATPGKSIPISFRNVTNNLYQPLPLMSSDHSAADEFLSITSAIGFVRLQSVL